MRYLTQKGDVLDAVCALHYGVGNFDLAKVYDVNIGLAAHGPVLPAGVEIELPEQVAPQTQTDMIRLVD